MEASLTCAVCLGVFREPVTLPRCSHNFCKVCVQDCASPQRSMGVQPKADRYITVTCPLCRKVSALSGGLASLSVNTTLAEVVRLLAQNGKSEEGLTAGYKCGSADGGSSGRSVCAQHPEHRLELFCKTCKQACCGKCVSLRHQGIFHNVNLLDTIFQEEKLVFFNSLKMLREIHERLQKEMSADEQNYESILNEEVVISSFGEVQKALDFKKEQLLDLIKQQRSTFKKRGEVRRVTRSHHKTMVESLLKDCESIVDVYEPGSFLKVACGLNKRMKSKLELMEFCADHTEDMSRLEPLCVDVEAVLDAVSALKIASGSKDVQKQNESFTFQSILRTWNPGMAANEKYCPVQDQELIYFQGQLQKMSVRYVCITKMPEYQHFSYEELRLKRYEPSVVVVQEREASASEVPNPFVPNVGLFNFSMPVINPVQSTRLKRHDGFDRECASVRKKHVFKEKSAKKDHGRMEISNICAVAIKKENIPVQTQVCPSSSLGLTPKLPSDIEMEKTSKLCNDISNKALFPNFCMGKSEIASIKKSGMSEKTCKKLKSTMCAPKPLSAGSVASTSAVAYESANIFSSAGNAEADRSVSSSSPEEFYDASCNIDPDVSEPCEQSSRHHSAGAEES
ncbi:tripartite motif-containing protein 5-like [Anomaloglossus baeobatrachus]|uniref:tripartite motif-containing protein 5-like n=1 Tax=Anomaloglossus baeobatrachus TaxID=238106 RepID=UPI003F4FC968